MNKTEFIAAVAQELGSTKADSAKAVEAVFKTITSSLKDKEDVRLIGFGSFKVKAVEKKTVRNPQNGEMIEVASSNRAKFTPGKLLKKALNS